MVTGRLAAGVLMVAGCAGCGGVNGEPAPASGSTSASTSASSGTLGTPTGFLVTLEHDEQPAAGPEGTDQVAWESAWILTWAPVPGADSYAVYYGTTEGGGGQEPERTTQAPTLRIEAAAGTSPSQRLAQDREAGLLFTSSQLLVSVAGVGPNGQQSPRSPWFAVGDAPADGRPIGTIVLGGVGSDP